MTLPNRVVMAPMTRARATDDALATDEAGEHVRSYADAAAKAAIAEEDQNTFYQGGDEGYITYPAYQYPA